MEAIKEYKNSFYFKFSNKIFYQNDVITKVK